MVRVVRDDQINLLLTLPRAPRHRVLRLVDEVLSLLIERRLPIQGFGDRRRYDGDGKEIGRRQGMGEKRESSWLEIGVVPQHKHINTHTHT